MAFIPRAELTAPRLADFLDLDDETFRSFFTGSPIKRIGRAKFLRNVLTAVGNSGAAYLVPRVESLLADESPLVRGSAIWALSQLMDEDGFDALRSRHERMESDPVVLAEWARSVSF